MTTELIIKAAIITGGIAYFIWAMKDAMKYTYEHQGNVIEGIIDDVRNANPIKAMLCVIWIGIMMIILTVYWMIMTIVTSPVTLYRLIRKRTKRLN
jgi:uncharacterized membrane-anchored protein